MNKKPIKTSKGTIYPDFNQTKGLIPNILTEAELNIEEAKNISHAIFWFESLSDRNKKPQYILDTGFVYNLHKKMFGRVWEWAGSPRKEVTNIGID